MHSPPPSLSLADGADAAPEARRDARLCDIVDDGILLMRVAGTLSALEFLKSRGVAGHVIARVLLDPGRRRRNPALALA
ncbi:MAG: hypothetical protein ACRYGO_09700 [Janthinobacterium lividum]